MLNSIYKSFRESLSLSEYGRYWMGEVLLHGTDQHKFAPIWGTIMRIDENMLAGYMAGELNESDRASVTAQLIRDRGMREWLGMAAEALAAAKAAENEGIMNRFIPNMNESRPGIRREDRRARPSAVRTRRVG